MCVCVDIESFEDELFMLYCLHHQFSHSVSSYQSRTHTPTVSVQINKSKALSRAQMESKENGRSVVHERVNKDSVMSCVDRYSPRFKSGWV